MRGYTMIRIVYSIIGTIITPLLVLWLIKRAARGKEERARMRERFGHASCLRPSGTLIWIHAASVGEVQSILTLARNILDAHETVSLLITTGTVTSARLVEKQKLARTQHQYVPLDTLFCARRFLRHWRPDLVLWVESEFWPQLLWQLHRSAIPIILVNARISVRSTKGWQRSPALIRSVLSCFRMIYAGSHDDAERLRALGAAHVIEAGNLKYDATLLPTSGKELTMLSEAIGSRAVWLAASTHANEEQKVAEAHCALRALFPDILTIIVPRHAIRGDAIAQDLAAKGMEIAQRSKTQPISSKTDIYLADTMGELGTFYRLAGITFLGGSLVSHGGQNPLEPARLNCTILTGPHTHNFAAIIEDLKRADGLREVSDAPALAATVAHLLNHEGERRAIASRAADVVHRSRGASTRILESIGTLLS